jgi:Protein of unknown function (DUF3105)
MSMSTGDVRRPSANKLSTKATATGGAKDEVIDSDAPAKPKTEPKSEPKAETRPGAKTAAKAATRSVRPSAKATPGKAGRPPAKAGGGKGRKPVKTVKVSQGRNWGPIAMFGGAGVLALLIVGFGAFQLIQKANQPSWQERAAGIQGIHNYLASNPDWFKVPAAGNHKAGVLSYPTSPPVGGIHNPYWQDCMGDVYTAEIPKEQATHSMEHGAVWVAYNPSLPKDQVAELAKKVSGKSFMLMSPYPGLDKPISLQAWGYQLKLDNASDGRIDDFIGALRQNTSQEPQAGCSSGITDTGKQPLNLTPPSPAAAPGG